MIDTINPFNLFVSNETENEELKSISFYISCRLLIRQYIKIIQIS